MSRPAAAVRRVKAAAQALSHPRGLQRVTGVVESVRDYVGKELGEPQRFELLRPAERVERPLAPTVGEPDPVFERLRTHGHPEVFRARLPGAQIAGIEPLVLTPDRRALLQSTYDREQLDANLVMHRRLHAARRRKGTHLLLHNQWGATHFHWMLDTLPRLSLLPLDAEPDAPVVIPAGLSRAGRRALALAGVPDDRVLEFDGTRLAVDELVFPSFVGSTGNPPGWALEWLRDRLVGDPRASTGRRLYVSRADATWRRVAGEDRVAAALAERGFEAILPGAMPLDEQLAAFAEAEAIVAPHGAALVNLVAARDAQVVELFGASYVNGCYFALCSALGLPYSYLVVGTRGRWDLEVDLSALHSALDAAGI